MVEKMDSWSEWYNNPLGYVRNDTGTVVKYWIRQEAEAVFSSVGGVNILESFRLDREQKTVSEALPEGLPKAWFWGWVLQRSAV
ncbi:hypothetical protein [Parasedimentitalea psychrophila]|uniref:Uncharacterized protein n=1 Tax=Parasedimentitalea psychrophila TaxID=2997337 RepID=A0A9Y2KVR1_9RHOB|nr:hypothetical protein [Parasedimentitalea psychrophila]WIY23563.1 hypothetical protein QPJ95_12940 [Parasedimentitalea psychrophila]